MKIASRRVVHCKNPTESRFSKFYKICAYLGDVSPDLDWSGIKFDGTASGHALSEALRLTKAVEEHTRSLQNQAKDLRVLIHRAAADASKGTNGTLDMVREEGSGKDERTGYPPAATTPNGKKPADAKREPRRASHPVDEAAGHPEGKRKSIELIEEPDLSKKIAAGAQDAIEHLQHDMEDGKGNDFHAEMRLRGHNILGNKRFDQFMGIIIMINAATIGYESDMQARQLPTPLGVIVLENLFMLAYTAEILARYYVYRKSAFIGHGSEWVKFDAFLVINSWISLFTNLAGLGEQGASLFI